jgi:hypothetical protein
MILREMGCGYGHWTELLRDRDNLGFYEYCDELFRSMEYTLLDWRGKYQPFKKDAAPCQSVSCYVVQSAPQHYLLKSTNFKKYFSSKSDFLIHIYSLLVST